jgi:hypothetical protein
MSQLRLVHPLGGEPQRVLRLLQTGAEVLNSLRRGISAWRRYILQFTLQIPMGGDNHPDLRV